MGTPSIFTIVSVAKEYLDELALHRQEAEKRREEAIALAEEEVSLLSLVLLLMTVGSNAYSVGRQSGCGMLVQP